MTRNILANSVILIFLFAVSCFYLISQPSSTGFKLNNLVQPLSTNSLKEAGERQRIEFGAKYKNLGIVQITFNSPEDIGAEFVEFRIRELGASTWHYQNNYPRSQFIANTPFPVGFPTIADSAGKYYEIELGSITSGRIKGITLIYNFPLSTLTNTDCLRSFIFNKLGNLLWDKDLLKQLFIAFLPLTLFVAIKKLKPPLHPTVFTALVLGDVLFAPLNDYTLTVISLYWTYSSLVFKIKSDASTKISFIFFIISLIYTLRQSPPVGEKAAIWSLVILTIAIFISLKELSSKKEAKIQL